MLNRVQLDLDLGNRRFKFGSTPEPRLKDVPSSWLYLISKKKRKTVFTIFTETLEAKGCVRHLALKTVSSSSRELLRMKVRYSISSRFSTKEK